MSTLMATASRLGTTLVGVGSLAVAALLIVALLPGLMFWPLIPESRVTALVEQLRRWCCDTVAKVVAEGAPAAISRRRGAGPRRRGVAPRRRGAAP
jgi:hypothetical protein